jgi:hypothetical protein
MSKDLLRVWFLRRLKVYTSLEVKGQPTLSFRLLRFRTALGSILILIFRFIGPEGRSKTWTIQYKSSAFSIKFGQVLSIFEEIEGIPNWLNRILFFEIRLRSTLILQNNFIKLFQPVFLILLHLGNLFRQQCHPQDLEELAESIKWLVLLEVVVGGPHAIVYVLNPVLHLSHFLEMLAVELRVAHLFQLGLPEHYYLFVDILIEPLECADHGALPLYLGIGLQHLLLEVVEQVRALLDSQSLLYHLLIVDLDEVCDITLYTCLKGRNL